MIDIVTEKRRSEMMSGIRSKDTKPELLVRRELHAMGFRYKLHDRSLPGRPDMVLPKYHSVVFVHGCFWHGHDCKYGKHFPKTNVEFWSNKRETNKQRDAKQTEQLVADNWNVIVVWECETRNYAAFRHRLSEIKENLNNHLQQAVLNHGKK